MLRLRPSLTRRCGRRVCRAWRARRPTSLSSRGEARVALSLGFGGCSARGARAFLLPPPALQAGSARAATALAPYARTHFAGSCVIFSRACGNPQGGGEKEARSCARPLPRGSFGVAIEGVSPAVAEKTSGAQTQVATGPPQPAKARALARVRPPRGLSAALRAFCAFVRSAGNPSARAA